MENIIERPCLSCKPCSDNVPLVLSSSPLIQVPPSIAKYLRNYQRDGVRFLYKRYKDGGGGILADDMGLGKTIQAIAFMAAILKMTGTKLDELRHVTNFIRNDVSPTFTVPSFNPILIICPASLSDNWKQEIITWGYFKVFKLNVSNRLEIINKAKHQECDIVVTTYEVARSLVDQLNSVQWSAVFLDEVHRIKDVNSKTTKAMSSITNKHRFGLTGTPMQNNLKEMWCLLNWANPNCLGQLSQFINNVMRPIEAGQKQSATKRVVTNGMIACVKFYEQSQKYMICRKKDLLAKYLPTKTDQVVFCELTPLQEEIYHALVCSPDLQMLLLQSKTHDCNKSSWISSSTAAQSSKTKASLLFTYLHLLQKTANHPALLFSSSATASSDVAYDICIGVFRANALLGGLNCKEKLVEALATMETSGKMQVLLQLVGAFWERKDKMLIFSYSTKILDIIEKQLLKNRLKFCRLDGTTPADSRLEIVQRFNTSQGPAIFLISTKAGGVGLNITGANVVIIFDPNWNPAHDLQAQDRAYRLGQQRDVRVYRLLSTATIEEFIYLRQLYKQQMASVSVNKASARRYFNSVSGDPRYQGELFGIQNIFSFRQSKRSLTEEILDRHANVESGIILKLEALKRDETCGAKVQLYSINDSLKETKGGFAALCEDLIGLHGEDYSKSDSESETIAVEEEEIEDGCCTGITEILNDSISDILEKTSAVRSIVAHDEIVAPSRAEEFMENCALRDVLQKHRNSQLPAFVCSSESQEVLPSHQAVGNEFSDQWLSKRSTFISWAKKAHLSPYDFSIKVLSMSPGERLQILNKFQDTGPSLASIDSNAHVTNLDTKISYQGGTAQHQLSGQELQNKSYFESKRKRKCSVSDGEQDAPKLLALPSIPKGKNTVTPSIAQRQNSSVSTEKNSGDGDECLNVPVEQQAKISECEKSHLCVSDVSPHQAMDASTLLMQSGCCISEQSSTILESLFFSNYVRKPCPKKQIKNDSSSPPLLFNFDNIVTSSVSQVESSNRFTKKQFDLALFPECSSPTLDNKQNDCHGDKSGMVSSPSMKNLMDEVFFSDSRGEKKQRNVGFHEVAPDLIPSSGIKDLLNKIFFNGCFKEKVSATIVETPNSEEYNVEDDIFRQLLNSGKLKLV